MVVGNGWMALALTTLATGRSARVLLDTYLFGFVTRMRFHLQGQSLEGKVPRGK